METGHIQSVILAWNEISSPVFRYILYYFYCYLFPCYPMREGEGEGERERIFECVCCVMLLLELPIYQKTLHNIVDIQQ